MREESSTWLAIGIALALSLGASAGAQPARPPARAALFDEAIPPTLGVTATLGSVTLRRGKARHLLRVDVRVSAGNKATTIALIQHVTVNGSLVFSAIRAEPAGAHMCGPGSACSAGASVWLDLDRAEAQSPGVFVGQPLEIEVVGRAEGDGGTRLGIFAELVRK